ncbi:hypothetical protein V9T40_012933 [Parthenolecanium corni]|uniref:Uncharacterized protein n=1 Tax=Parthenolecanium corni TaxID=536013 RepID=A0AAN9XZT8_9HEMI
MSSLQTTDCLKEKLFRDSRDIRDQNSASECLGLPRVLFWIASDCLGLLRNPRQSEAAQGNPRQREAIRGNARHSKAARGNSRQRKAIRGNPRQRKAIQGSPKQSEGSPRQASDCLGMPWSASGSISARSGSDRNFKSIDPAVKEILATI